MSLGVTSGSTQTIDRFNSRPGPASGLVPFVLVGDPHREHERDRGLVCLERPHDDVEFTTCVDFMDFMVFRTRGQAIHVTMLLPGSVTFFSLARSVPLLELPVLHALEHV